MEERDVRTGPRRRRAPAASARRLAGAALLLFALAPRATGGAEPAPEYEVKAAFLYNFARFVEWPAEAFSSADDPIIVCVAGEDPFGESLDRAVAGRTAQGRPLLIQRPRRPGDLGFCHIFFVGASEDEGRWLSALDDLQGSGALTVGEGPGFGRLGSIAFVIERKHVELHVNLDAAEQKGLRISARLLAVARVAPRASRGESR